MDMQSKLILLTVAFVLVGHEGNVKTFTNKWYGEQTCLPSPP